MALQPLRDGANGGKRVVKVSSIIGSIEFAAGFIAARKGVPFNPDAFVIQGQDRQPGQWRYERGRQFAHIWPHAYPRSNAALHRACVVYSENRANGVLI